MKIDSNGKFLKYWVSDRGIVLINEDHIEFNNPAEEYAIFETFEEAALFAIESLSSRIKELEGSG